MLKAKSCGGEGEYQFLPQFASKKELKVCQCLLTNSLWCVCGGPLALNLFISPEINTSHHGPLCTGQESCQL